MEYSHWFRSCYISHTFSTFGSVNTLAVSGDGNLLSGGADETIKIWNTNDGSLIKSLHGHYGAVLSLTFLLDGSLASGSADKTIKIWKLY